MTAALKGAALFDDQRRQVPIPHPNASLMLEPKHLFKSLLPNLLLAALALTGCQLNWKHNVDLQQFVGQQFIKDYLSAKVASTGFGGKAYCAYDVLAAESDGETDKLYLWVLCQEYYHRNGSQTLQPGTGMSLPIALTLPKNASERRNLSNIYHQQPRDGALYVEDMQVIFPKGVRTRIDSESPDTHNQRVRRLQQEAKRDAGIS